MIRLIRRSPKGRSTIKRKAAIYLATLLFTLSLGFFALALYGWPRLPRRDTAAPLVPAGAAGRSASPGTSVAPASSSAPSAGGSAGGAPAEAGGARACPRTGKEFQVPPEFRAVAGRVYWVKIDYRPVCFPDAQPFVERNTRAVMVPVRAIAAALNMEVHTEPPDMPRSELGFQPLYKFLVLDGYEEHLTGRRHKRVVMKPGDNYILVNGWPYRVESPNRVIAGHFYVDGKALLHALRVNYDIHSSPSNLTPPESGPLMPN